MPQVTGDAALRQLAGALSVRADIYADDFLPYFFESLPRYRDSDAFDFELGLSTLQEVHTEILRLLINGLDPKSAQIGRCSIQWARTMVRERIPMHVAERGYRLTSSWIWERWLKDLDEMGQELVPGQLRASSATVFGGLDAIAQQFAGEYGRAVRRIETPDGSRTAALRAVLRLGPQPAGLKDDEETLSRLGYPAAAHHLAVVARCEPSAAAADFARDVSDRFAASDLSVIRTDQIGSGECLWIAGDLPALELVVDKIETMESPSRHVEVGLGRIRYGAPGFRETYKEARTALGLRSRYTSRTRSVRSTCTSTFATTISS